MRKLNVVQEPEKEIPFDVMAKSIESIGKALAKLSTTRLTEKMIVALVHDDTKIAKGTIEKVLVSFGELEKNYLKDKKTKT